MQVSTQSNKQLRSFGFTVGAVFLVIGLWPLLRRGDVPRLWALLPGAALVLLGAVMPSALQQPCRLWMRIGHLLGWINTKILLTLMFFTVFTPAAALMRIFGKDPMTRKLDRGVETYRVLSQVRDGGHMRHQF